MIYRFDDFEIDPGRRHLSRGGVLVPLEPQVFDLLQYLVENCHRVVSRDEVIAAVWHGRIVSDSAISTRINAVRSALGDSGAEQRLLKTFPRKGIRLVAAVRTKEDDPAAAPTTSIELSAINSGPSIVVLRFANLSGDPDQEYFAEGMAEEIITALCRFSSLTVIARNSAFGIKTTDIDHCEVGREFGVRYVVDGSVRKAGTRLRISGRLIEVASGAQLWGDRFDGEMSDAFELQDRIAESIVGAIEPSLLQAEINRVRRNPATSVDAYDFLLRAQQQMHEFTRDSLAAALVFVDRALAVEPDYAAALALGAYCRAQRVFQGWWIDPVAEKTVGLQQACRAVELARDDAGVLCLAGYAVRELGLDPRRSNEFVARSLQINPNSYLALTVAGWNEIVLGSPKKSLELLARAERLNPRDPRAWFMNNAAALAHIAGGDYEAAIARTRRSLAQNPRSAQALRFQAACFAHLGQKIAAQQSMREALAVEPSLSILTLRTRLTFMPEPIWERLSEGFRLAGLPERPAGQKTE